MVEIPTKQQDPTPLVRRKSRALQYLAIAMLAIAVFFLFDSATDEEVLDISRLIELSEQEYDYFMANVDSMHYTLDGRADYRFRADRVTHYPNPEYSLVDSPRFIIFIEDDSAWRINADSGRVEMDTERNQERLILSENVIINGITAEGRPVDITTESLTVWPQDRNMQTDSQVQLVSSGLTTTSQGLFADMNTNVIRQLSDGQMRYEPNETTGQAQ